MFAASLATLFADKYQRFFKQRNSAKLEKMKADKVKADKVIQQMETKAAGEKAQREASEKEAKSRANEDRWACGGTVVAQAKLDPLEQCHGRVGWGRITARFFLMRQ